MRHSLGPVARDESVITNKTLRIGVSVIIQRGPNGIGRNGRAAGFGRNPRESRSRTINITSAAHHAELHTVLVTKDASGNILGTDRNVRPAAVTAAVALVPITCSAPDLILGGEQ